MSRQKTGLFTAVILATMILSPSGTMASSNFPANTSNGSSSTSCVHYIDDVLQSRAPLSAAQADSMIQTAESSSAYETLGALGQPILPATSSPVEDYAIQYSTSNDCSTVTILGDSFNFVVGDKQVAILVNAQNTGVISSQVVPPVKWGAGNQSNSNWFGYGFWEGGTYSNPTTPYDYVLGTFAAPYSYNPACGSPCQVNMAMGIWSGLTNTGGGGYRSDWDCFF